MPKQLFSNNASSTLSTGVNNSATSLVLTDGSKFPSPTGGNYFHAALIGLNGSGQENSWEIVRCTARSSNTLTVVRAQESTAAASWGVGVRIELRVASEFANAVATHMETGGTEHPAATVSVAGFMSAADKTKVDGLVTNATHTGDATGATALTVVRINGTQLSSLATGLLKNTTATGVPSIAVSGTDIKTINGTSLLGSGDVVVSGSAPGKLFFTRG